MRQPQKEKRNMGLSHMHASVDDVRSERRRCTAEQCQGASCAVAQCKASAITGGQCPPHCSVD